MKFGIGIIASLWLKPRLIIHITPFTWGLIAFIDTEGQDQSIGIQVGPVYISFIA